MSNLDELQKLADLHKAGVLSDAEFQEQKQRLLNPEQSTQAPPQDHYQGAGYGHQQPPGYEYAPAGYDAFGHPIDPYGMRSHRSLLVAILLCFFLGPLGAHRFYTGHVGIGLVQLFTAGGCGIWALVDLILLATGSYTDVEGRQLNNA
ncbi:MAG: NINE protein [Myxococcota bacterium]|nr:NINE protein [Myxococcota bacterium]